MKIPLRNSLRKRYPLIIFILIYLIFSGITYRDFGITGDEPNVYTRGENLIYYFTGDEKLSFDFIREPEPARPITYGVYYNNFYPMVLSLFNPDRSFEQYHLLNMCFASLAFMAAYELLLRKYGSIAALLGPIFLVLTPRFFGDIPANPKDMPFAVMYLFSLAVILNIRSIKNDIIRVLILGIVFGITQSLRLVGLSIYPVYLIYGLYEHLLQGKGQAKILPGFLLKHVFRMFFILTIASILSIVTQPYLSSNFFTNITRLIGINRQFEWGGTVLFRGEYIDGSKIDWTYLVDYLLYTTPVFLMGLFFLSPLLLKDRLRNSAFVLLVISFTVNLTGYFIIRPVIYNGVRHYLYLLPMVAVIGAMSIIRILTVSNKAHKLLLYLIIPGILFTAVQMIRLHPYEYIYFNELIGGVSGSYDLYDTDYWGASYAESTKWLINHEINNSAEVYRIHTCGDPKLSSYYFTSKMKWVPHDASEIDYVICFTRWQNYEIPKSYTLLHTVDRDGVPLNYIYKVD